MIIKIYYKIKRVFQEYFNPNFLRIPSQKKIEYFKRKVKIIDSKTTLLTIKKTIESQQKGAYLRLGHGDIYLMLGKNELLNDASKKISKELKEAFLLNTGKIHKGIPIYSKLFGYDKGMVLGMHLETDIDAIKYLNATYKLVDLSNIYNHVALHYTAVYEMDFCVSFLQFLKNTHPIFVGNENIQPTLVNKLFGNIHIKTPAQKSYEAIDTIEENLLKALNYDKKTFRVIVVAMGCPGRVLQKRILKKGYNVYLFDFGSLLDALNDDDTRDWITLGGGVQKLKEILNQLT